MHRLEARAAVQNGRGNGALLKIGRGAGRHPAQVVRQATAQYLDQVLYAILEEDWRAKRPATWPVLVGIRVH